MKKSLIKKLSILFLLVALAFSSLFLADLIKKEKIRKEEEAAALRAKEEAERIAAEKEAARLAEEEAKRKAEEDRRTRNPLTGLKMAESAIGKRPAAFMVENTPPARPQWGMDDARYSPDIILEGEVEGGITRTMWLFADFNALPELIGPMRSARPPYVRFSELFDAIYIHWGQSDSAGTYIGASDVIARDGVDNINQLQYRGQVELFGRNRERDVAIEHTGVVYTKNLPQAIAEYGYRTERNPDHFSNFEFTDEDLTVSNTPAKDLVITISSRSWVKHWTYSDSDKLYHTDDFENKLTRKNILIFYDETEYITKPGAHFSYCNYHLDHGTGKYATMGTVMDIKWAVEKEKLVIRDSNDQIVPLNRGKTYIAWISSNLGGDIQIN
ncbi:MAG: DUF3048 domain-containing protein [Erysipelotrichaceae bacterium]|nr:DUF3048 domain-containing protein [Erysipelotrichaceae bacterium]